MGEQHFNFLAQPSRGAAAGDQRLPVDGVAHRFKRLGSPYRSGRADCWLKVKNPAAAAVTRESEEEW
jgi:hypothetical protein